MFALMKVESQKLPQTSQSGLVPPPESAHLDISCVWDVCSCLQSENETLVPSQALPPFQLTLTRKSLLHWAWMKQFSSSRWELADTVLEHEGI